MNKLVHMEAMAEYDRISEWIHDYAIEAEVSIIVDLPSEFSAISSYVVTKDSDMIYNVYKMLQNSIRYVMHMLRGETSNDEKLPFIIDYYLEHHELDALRDIDSIDIISRSVMHVCRIVEEQLHKHGYKKLFCIELQEQPVLDCSLHIFIYTEEHYG